MTNKLIFTRCTSKREGAPINGITRYHYEMSDGTKLLSKHNLYKGRWYFIEFSVNALQQRSFESFEAVPNSEAEVYNDRLAEVKRTAHDVVKMWKQLNVSERQLVMRKAGVVLSGVTATSLVINGIAGEALLGSLTGGLSLLAGVAMAGFTYLQHEEAEAAVAKHQAVLTEFLRKKALFDRQAARFMPARYDSLEFANPAYASIVTRLKDVISNITAENFANLPVADYKWSGVTA